MSHDTLLNVAHLLLQSRANGPGLRAVIWVQGCPILCPGCHNQEMLPFEKRFIVHPVRLIYKIMAAVPALEGITLTGGEPSAQAKAAAIMLKAAKMHRLTTMVYSGYNYTYLSNSPNPAFHEMFAFTDILVAGPFIQTMQGSFRWKGSANQEVLFLSDAYNPHEVLTEHIFDEEVHVDSTGQSVITGFPHFL